MAWTRRLLRKIIRLAPRNPLRLVYDESYRLPLTSLQRTTGFDPRRPDLALWYLRDSDWLPERAVLKPPRISYHELAQVHTQQWLEELGRAEPLARALGVEPWDIDVDSVMSSLRTICGGTVLAAQVAVRERLPVLNLAGGFHHAFADHGGGMCVLSDIGLAVAQLRADGFVGRIGVLDLDAHPPDGTRAVLLHLGERLGRERDDTAWIGSISGSNWGLLPQVDESVLPPATGDDAYLRCLDGLLGRMPPCALLIVVAGGDVLAGDPLGQLGLTVAGVQRRDRKVVQALGKTPSVWLPGGGYREVCWQVLANTALAILGVPAAVPPQLDPLSRHFALVAHSLNVPASDGLDLDMRDIENELGVGSAGPPRLLGYYTAEAVEYIYYKLGILQQIKRLGYHALRIEIRESQPADHMRLVGQFEGDAAVHVLVDVAMERRHEPEGDVLFVHWLELRHPRGSWSAGRPPLPGQSVPGLGLAREAGVLLAATAQRLGMAGVVLRPAWFHVAYSARYRFRFRRPEVQGRFEALLRDLQAEPRLHREPGGFALGPASRAIARGDLVIQRSSLAPISYCWESEEMIDVLHAATAPEAQATVDREREHVHFSLAPNAVLT